MLWFYNFSKRLLNWFMFLTRRSQDPCIGFLAYLMKKKYIYLVFKSLLSVLKKDILVLRLQRAPKQRFWGRIVNIIRLWLQSGLARPFFNKHARGSMGEQLRAREPTAKADSAPNKPGGPGVPANLNRASASSSVEWGQLGLS